MNVKLVGSVSAVVLGMLGSSVALAIGPGPGKYTFPAGAFVTEPFDFNLSANVTLLAAESDQLIAVATASSKGSYIYAGSSLGGAVATCGEKTVIGTSPVDTLAAPSTEAADSGCSSS